MPSGIPVVLTDGAVPITPTSRGVPVTIVGGTTIAAVSNGAALEIPVTGTYTDTVTFTVEDGQITAIALS